MAMQRSNGKVTEVEDEEFVDETIVERIVALKEMIPEQPRAVLGSGIEWAHYVGTNGWWLTRKVLWLTASTAVILGMPQMPAIVADTMIAESEAAALQQQQQASLVLGVDTTAMGGVPKPVPS
eukprot:m.67792 g.67792  ORF g.67792 m.67792 type:complete len:123 (-) comp23870_c0_seq1:147-515(-)